MARVDTVELVVEVNMTWLDALKLRLAGGGRFGDEISRYLKVRFSLADLAGACEHTWIDISLVSSDLREYLCANCGERTTEKPDAIFAEATLTL